MKQQLTTYEIEKLKSICFSNPAKACAIAQQIIDTCQIISCSTFSNLSGKAKRTINYKAEKMIGIKIEERKFPSYIQ